MNLFKNALATLCALSVAMLVCDSVIAQTQNAPKKVESARTEAPDGSPTLPRDTSINQSTADAVGRGRDAARGDDGDAPLASSEERIESRLAVIRAGRTTVKDPNVGRYDRAASSTGKRVAPTMWELFRF